jgi:hypothetical protein
MRIIGYLRRVFLFVVSGTVLLSILVAGLNLIYWMFTLLTAGEPAFYLFQVQNPVFWRFIGSIILYIVFMPFTKPAARNFGNGFAWLFSDDCTRFLAGRSSPAKNFATK